jgi:hypothetical protein
VEFVAELPTTATGKIQKYELREREWADEDRRIGEGRSDRRCHTGARRRRPRAQPSLGAVASPGTPRRVSRGPTSFGVGPVGSQVAGGGGRPRRRVGVVTARGAVTSSGRA